MWRLTQKQHGFTLVEIALVLAVLGLFVGSVISFMDVEDDQRAFAETQYRQKRIAIAISDFANQHGYVPCPTAHNASHVDFGYSMGTGTACSNHAAGSVGIVPFKTLGLPMREAYDGYGNLMELVVFQPAYTAQNQTTVHRDCRLGESNPLHATYPFRTWIYSGTNISPLKARFCCARAVSGAGIIEPVWPDLQVNSSVPAGEWVNINTAHNAALTPARNLAYYAYSLISYGKNGSGAPIYRGPGQCSGTSGFSTPCRVQASGPASGSQQRASTYDDPMLGNSAFWTTFYRTVRPAHPVRGPSYYDNIILWRTQEQVISETGVTDCRGP